VDTGRECRWVDGGGHEWLIAREGGSLIVERPQTGESVVVRFPDLALEALDGPPTEAWMLFCAADGHLFHCSICREAEVIEFSRNNRQRIGATAPRRPDDDRRADCGCRA
jgi:hypothetical protein